MAADAPAGPLSHILRAVLRRLAGFAARLRRGWTGPRAAEARYRSLAAAVEQTSEGVVITDGQGLIQYVNPAFTRMTGYTAEEAVGRNPRFLKSGKHTAEFYAKLWRTVLSGQTWYGDMINRRKDGSLYQEQMTITPVRDQRGEITRLIAIKKDLAERKRADEADEKYRFIIENIPDMVWTADESGKCVFTTPNIESISGYTPDEAYEAPDWFTFIHPDDLPRVQAAFAAFLDGKAPFTAEYRMRRKDGSWVWLSDKSKRSYQEGGRRFFVGVASDITERKRIEQSLLESEQKYRSLIANIPDVVWVEDSEGKIAFVSPNVEQMLGVAPEVFYERGTAAWQELIHPEDAPGAAEAFRNLYEKGTRYDVEFRVRGAAGEWRWMRDRAVLRQRKDGKIQAHGLLSDITDLKRVQQERRIADERYRRLFERNLAGVFRTQWDGRILDCNPALAHALGFRSRQEALQSGVQSIDLYARSEDRDALLAKLKTAGDLTNHEIELRRTDGKTVWFVANASVVEDDSSGLPVIEGTLFDISGRKQAEAEMKQAKEAAEAANQAKSAFLANMSHEIRTPLNGMLGMTELALQTDLTDEQREYLEIARNSGESLLSVINDILDFSKLEARRLTLERIDFGLRETLAGALKPMAAWAAEKGVELTLEVSSSTPDNLCGDPGRLRQIILNLVGNALKFTERGEVAVSVETMPESGPAAALSFAVRDTGIGIPADKQQTIFEAFSQVDSSITRRFGGTGLGLTICAQLVSMMGGEIRVESEQGKGSVFRFTARFDLARDRAAPPSPVETRPLAGLAALAVDDNPTSRRVLRDLLESWGMTVTLSPDGAGALERLRRAAREGNPFALLVADGRMPGMNGFQLVEAIASDPSLAGLPSILLTPVGQRRPGGAPRAACLNKPVGGPELLQAILREIGRTPRAAGAGPKAPPLPVRQLRILVVDDNSVNRRLAARLLEKHGHIVKAVESGTGAVEAFARGRFDLVLMDVQMPGMDGLEATAAIRRLESALGAHVPIVAMTAHALEGDRQRCLNAGMDDYTSKPINIKELLSKMDRLCSRN